MSRIGKKPVQFPAGVTITVGSDNVVTVKGPKGELKQAVDRDIKFDIKEGEVEVLRPTDQIRHKAMHGLYRSLISNMVKGVTEGYTKKMELVGWTRTRTPARRTGMRIMMGTYTRPPGQGPQRETRRRLWCSRRG